MADVPIAQQVPIAQPIDSEKVKITDARSLSLKDLRSIESKAIKSILAGIVAYNTAHRLFTKKEDRDRDLRWAMKTILDADISLGEPGVTTFVASAGNYLVDFGKDKTRRLTSMFARGSAGGKRRKLLTRKKRRA